MTVIFDYYSIILNKLRIIKSNSNVLKSKQRVTYIGFLLTQRKSKKVKIFVYRVQGIALILYVFFMVFKYLTSHKSRVFGEVFKNTS